MVFAGMGVAGVIDFKDLFERPSPSPPPPAVKPEKTHPAKQVPPATHKKVQSAGNAQATLAWDSVPGAISYNIYWRNQPGVTKHNGEKIANVKNPHTLKDLIPGETYYLVVRPSATAARAAYRRKFRTLDVAKLSDTRFSGSKVLGNRHGCLSGVKAYFINLG